MTSLHEPDTRVAVPLRITNLPELAERIHDLGIPVHGADAIGLGLHTNGHLGADMLRVPAHASFPVHTHPGDHLLLCLAGTGTITVNEHTYDVVPGDLYMVDGLIPHAVGAGPTEHILIAIGAPHKPVDSPERMTFTDWTGQRLDTPLFHERRHETGA
jgi:quercetin dioxygenase-like cupin family protein